jgi:hypothetical protein
VASHRTVTVRAKPVSRLESQRPLVAAPDGIMVRVRLPKWLDLLERSIAAKGGPYTFGANVTYVDFLLVSIINAVTFIFGV